MNLRLGILTSHPIQYQAPLFRALASQCDLTVYFAQRQTPQAQAAAGFGVNFDWDVDLLAGYSHEFLRNVAAKPDTGSFFGCDTPAVADEIDRGGFDAFIIMGWHLKCFWQAVRACHRHRVPVMVRGDSHLSTQRSLIKKGVKSLVYPSLLRQFDGCLYVGTRNLEYLQYYDVPSERLFFAPHCVDTNAFAASAALVDRESVRANWGLTRGASALLFVGKMIPGKRVTDLIEAAGHLRTLGHKAFVVLAGDGPQRNELETQSRGLNVPAVFLGFRNQTELAAIYRAADVLVLPSSSETWGLVVNEALACGTPCVVSEECGCATDMVLQGKTGITFKSGDVAGLTNSLLRALKIPRDSRAIADHCARYSISATAQGIASAAAVLRAK